MSAQEAPIDVAKLRHSLSHARQHSGYSCMAQWAAANGETLLTAYEQSAAMREALKPFALSIRDDVPDDQLIESVGWTAAEHRRAYAALALPVPSAPQGGE